MLFRCPKSGMMRDNIHNERRSPEANLVDKTGPGIFNQNLTQTRRSDS